MVVHIIGDNAEYVKSLEAENAALKEENRKLKILLAAQGPQDDKPKRVRKPTT